MRFPRPAWALDARPWALLGAATVLQWASVATAAAWSRAPEELGDPLVLLNVAVLGPLALAAAFLLARALGGRALAVWTLLVWLAAPWLLAAFALPSYDATARDYLVPLLLGLAPEPGYAAGAAVLVAAVLLSAAAAGAATYAAAGAGAAAGAAAALDPAALPFAAASALVLLASRRLGAAGGLAAGALPLLGLAAIRHGFDPDERSLDALRGAMTGLREYFWSQRLLQWLPLAGAIAVARRSVPLASYLGGGLLGVVALQASLPAAAFEEGRLFRLLLAGLPAYVVVTAAIPLLVPTLAARLGDDARPLPLRRGAETGS